jgi:hypothetical protein
MDMPLVGIVYLIALCLGFLVLIVLTDNKRKPLPRPSTDHRRWRAVVVRRVPHAGDPRRAAFSALEGLSAKDVVVDEGCAAGWVGHWWTNIGRYAQYQIAVEYMSDADAETTFVCACRPRFSSQLTGHRQAQRLAEQLAAAVGRDSDDV